MMGHRFLIGWAVAATALALVLLGVLIGRSTGTDTVTPRVAAGYDASSTDTSSADAVAEPVYTVPDIFEGLPSEWRSQTESEAFDGYAILFDPTRREVIVEQCLHRGYVTEDGSPLDTNYEFCDGILWATVLDIGVAGATVRDRTGEMIDLVLDIQEEDDQPVLLLSFPGHEMALIPGSKNDLLQAMENSPRMIGEKQQHFEALQSQHRERRRAQEAMAGDKPQDIPTYTLPADDDERKNN